MVLSQICILALTAGSGPPRGISVPWGRREQQTALLGRCCSHPRSLIFAVKHTLCFFIKTVNQRKMQIGEGTGQKMSAQRTELPRGWVSMFPSG